jgi:hypothetical protein
MAAIEGSLADQRITNPNDLTFLINHMRQLPEEAKKYLLWATFFGETWVWNIGSIYVSEAS